jgi:hypothetical protein
MVPPRVKVGVLGAAPVVTVAVPVGAITTVPVPPILPVFTAPVLVVSDSVPVTEVMVENVMVPVPVLSVTVPVDVSAPPTKPRLVLLMDVPLRDTAPTPVNAERSVTVGALTVSAPLYELAGVQAIAPVPARTSVGAPLTTIPLVTAATPVGATVTVPVPCRLPVRMVPVEVMSVKAALTDTPPFIVILAVPALNEHALLTVTRPLESTPRLDALSEPPVPEHVMLASESGAKYATLPVSTSAPLNPFGFQAVAGPPNDSVAEVNEAVVTVVASVGAITSVPVPVTGPTVTAPVEVIRVMVAGEAKIPPFVSVRLPVLRTHTEHAVQMSGTFKTHTAGAQQRTQC